MNFYHYSVNDKQIFFLFNMYFCLFFSPSLFFRHRIFHRISFLRFCNITKTLVFLYPFWSEGVTLRFICKVKVKLSLDWIFFLLYINFLLVVFFFRLLFAMNLKAYLQISNVRVMINNIKQEISKLTNAFGGDRNPRPIFLEVINLRWFNVQFFHSIYNYNAQKLFLDFSNGEAQTR